MQQNEMSQMNLPIYELWLITFAPSKKFPGYSAGGFTRAASKPTIDFMVDSRAALPYYKETSQSRL